MNLFMFQHRQWHRSERENGVVEAPLIEPGAELLFGVTTMAADLNFRRTFTPTPVRVRDVATRYPLTGFSCSCSCSKNRW